MNKKIQVQSSIRTKEDGKINKIRKDGFLPAVLYGQGGKAQNLKVKLRDFEKAFNEAGETTLIDLMIDEKESVKVIVKDVQRNPIHNNIIHADLYKVNMDELIEVEVPLNFVGESKAERELGGTLSKKLEFVLVSCLPIDLIDHIDVDISVLNTFEDSIKISDLKIPDTIKILNHESGAVASVVAMQKEEVVAEKPAVAAPAKGAEKKEEKPAAKPKK